MDRKMFNAEKNSITQAGGELRRLELRAWFSLLVMFLSPVMFAFVL